MSDHSTDDSPPVNVSVLLNVWCGDDPNVLRLSLRSVREQTLRPSELVVIIDGPIAEHLSTVLDNELAEMPFSVSRQEIPENKGLWFARNLGIQACNHEIVALHDADDLMHPLRLEFQVKELLKLDLVIVSSPAIEYDTTNYKIVGLRRTQNNSILKISDCWLRNPINHSAVMMQKSRVTAIGSYHNHPGLEDFDMWRRLISSGAKIMNTNEVLQALGTSKKLLQRRRMNIVLARNEFLMARAYFLHAGVTAKWQAVFGFLLRCAYRFSIPPIMALLQRLYLRRRHSKLPISVNDFLVMKPLSLS